MPNRFAGLSPLAGALLIGSVLAAVLAVVELLAFAVSLLMPPTTFPKRTLYRATWEAMAGRETAPGALDATGYPYQNSGAGFGRYTGQAGYDPWLGYRVVPFERFRNVVADRYGFFHNGDPDRDLSGKPPGTFRIVMLGGSTVAGDGASSSGTTIAAQLEQFLNATGDRSGRRYEVVNAGAPGYVSAQESILFDLELVHYAPDMVITLDGWNDAELMLTPNAGRDVYIPNRKPYHDQLVRHMGGVYTGDTTAPDWARVTYQTFFHPDRYYVGRLLKPLLTAAIPRRVSPASPGPVAMRFDPERVAYYRSNLVAILGSARARGLYSLHFLQPNLVWGDKRLTHEEERLLTEAESRVAGRNRREEFVRAGDALKRMFAELARRYGGDAGVRIGTLHDTFDEYAGQIYVDLGHYNDTGNGLLARRLRDAIVGVLDAATRTSAGALESTRSRR